MTFTLIPTDLASNSFELLAQHNFSKLGGQRFPRRGRRAGALAISEGGRSLHLQSGLGGEPSAMCSAQLSVLQALPSGTSSHTFHRHGYHDPAVPH